MNQPTSVADSILKPTKRAFLWNRILNIPFWSLLSLLTIILYKELQISAFQVATLIALKPMSALFAPYWSSSLHTKQGKIIPNLVWANILRYLPFLLFPWMHSAWLMIASLGFYMMLQRGAMPAWMEILKRNIKGMERERLFAFGSSVDYLGPALVPLLVGFVLDDTTISWRWLFFGTAIVGLASTYFLMKIPSTSFADEKPVPQPDLSFSQQILKPISQSWNLLKERPDFAKFQIGFLFGGIGLMFMISAQTMFFVDVLKLSYTEMALAIGLCKGIGFAATSPFWVRLFRRIDIYLFSGIVPLLAALFPLLLIGAEQNIAFLYGAYLLYGFMQAGSELCWHMSGPVFAGEADSSLYSQTNVLMVGLRGCVAPYLGSLLYIVSNSTTVLLIGALFCLIASERLWHYRRIAAAVPDQSI